MHAGLVKRVGAGLVKLEGAGLVKREDVGLTKGSVKYIVPPRHLGLSTSSGA